MYALISMPMQISRIFGVFQAMIASLSSKGALCALDNDFHNQFQLRCPDTKAWNDAIRHIEWGPHERKAAGEPRRLLGEERCTLLAHGRYG